MTRKFNGTGRYQVDITDVLRREAAGHRFRYDTVGNSAIARPLIALDSPASIS